MVLLVYLILQEGVPILLTVVMRASDPTFFVCSVLLFFSITFCHLFCVLKKFLLTWLHYTEFILSEPGLDGY